MTLLFFLRSPAGNTDTGQAPDVSPVWSYDDVKPERKKKEKRLAPKISHKEPGPDAVDASIKRRRKKKRKEEELLMMLFMHEFDGYEN